MPMVECPHCGETNFTIRAMAILDRCGGCGRRLARAGTNKASRFAVQESKRLGSDVPKSKGRVPTPS